MHNVPNLDEASQPLALAWAQTLAQTPGAAATLLASLSAESPPGLAHHFYDVLLEDPRAGRWRGWDKTECGIHEAVTPIDDNPANDPAF